MLCDLLLFQKSLTQALIPVVVPAKALMPTMLVQEHKDKIINTNGTQGFNVVRPTMLTSTDERELFHYTIENIIEERTAIL